MNPSMHIGIAAAATALSVGIIGYGAVTAVGRNPGASTKILVQAILAIAFAESIGIFALVIALLLKFV